MVTDANGLIAVDGIHTVTSGNTSCYGVATTVSVASLALTESVRDLRYFDLSLTLTT